MLYIKGVCRNCNIFSYEVKNANNNVMTLTPDTGIGPTVDNLLILLADSKFAILAHLRPKYT